MSATLGLSFHAYLNSEHSLKHCRRRKARTVFSDHQLNGLEKRFDGQKYLSTPERVELANALNLSEAQVTDTLLVLTRSLFSLLSSMIRSKHGEYTRHPLDALRDDWRCLGSKIAA